MSVQPTEQTTIAKSTIATLACRLLALWVFIQVVTSLIPVVMVSIVGVTASQKQVEALMMGILTGGPLLLLLAIAFFLWKKAEVIASRMLSQSDDPIAISGFSSQELLSIAFAAIGMYALVNALPQLGRHLAVAFWQNSRLVDSWNSPNWQIAFWINLFQIGIGAWLMLGMHGIARVVRSLQRSNLPEEETIPSDQNIQN